MSPADAVKELTKLLSKAFEIWDKKEDRKYVERIDKIQKEIDREEAKGDMCDDAKLETLYKDLQRATTAAYNDLISRAGK